MYKDYYCEAWRKIDKQDFSSREKQTTTPYIEQRKKKERNTKLTFLKPAINLIGTQPWSSMLCRKNVSLHKFSLLQQKVKNALAVRCSNYDKRRLINNDTTMKNGKPIK